VVNPLGVIEPMVGWKRAPYGWVETSTPFSSHITPYGSYKCFHALCFELEIMDACVYLYVYKRFLY
jgi:hypothetical protein